MTMLVDKEHLQLVNYLTQSTRLKIIIELAKTDDPMYITEIALQINETARNTSFHLMKLAEKGFVKGVYRELPTDPAKQGSGRPAKFYSLTDVGKDRLSKLRNISF